MSGLERSVMYRLASISLPKYREKVLGIRKANLLDTTGQEMGKMTQQEMGKMTQGKMRHTEDARGPFRLLLSLP